MVYLVIMRAGESAVEVNVPQPNAYWEMRQSYTVMEEKRGLYYDRQTGPYIPPRVETESQEP
jgi:hypothetical protein